MFDLIGFDLFCSTDAASILTFHTFFNFSEVSKNKIIPKILYIIELLYKLKTGDGKGLKLIKPTIESSHLKQRLFNDNTIDESFYELNEDQFYQPIFFAFALRQLQVYQISDFLDYHFEKYKSNFVVYVRFILDNYGSKGENIFFSGTEDWIRDWIEEKTPDKQFRSNIQWKNDNSTEFAQLLYALFHAGYIDNKKNEVTKIVPELATILNFQLSKNWKQNLSTSINKSRRDYEPQIFDNLKKSYMEYHQNQLEKE